MVSLSDAYNIFKKTEKYSRFSLNEESAKKFSEELRDSLWSRGSGSSNRTYGRVLFGTEGRSQRLFQISLINDFMVSEDHKFINCVEKLNSSNDSNDLTPEDKEILEKYHPYSWEFFTGRLTKEESEFLRNLEEEWVEVEIFKFDEKTTPPKNDENNIFIKGMMYFSEINDQDQLSLLQVTNKKPTKKISIDQMWQLIKNYFDNENDTKIKESWEHDTSLLDENLQVTALNVGQGNCIALDFDNGPDKVQIFFDVGLSPYPHTDEKKYIDVAKKYLAVSSPNWVVLSHWHIDHIKGYSSMTTDNNFKIYSNCYWIAPDTRSFNYKPSNTQINLCYYLLENHIMWLVKNSNLPNNYVSESSGKKMSLWQGTYSKCKNTGSVVNNTGLILKILLQKKHLLFAGDCSYQYMPTPLKDVTYDLLVVPHHGSHKTNVEVNGTLDSLAIFSVGHNLYGHPSAKHIGELNMAYFNLYFTAGTYGIRYVIKFGRSSFHILRSEDDLYLESCTLM